MSGIQGMIDCVACTPQIDCEPCPSWKMNTMIPYAAASETRLRITAFSGSTSERNARAAIDRVAAAGEVLRLRLAGIQVQARIDEHAHDREADRRDRNRPAHDEVRPTSPQAVLRMPGVDEPLWKQAHAVDPGAERREQ